jgi:hypothetical protein
LKIACAASKSVARGEPLVVLKIGSNGLAVTTLPGPDVVLLNPLTNPLQPNELLSSFPFFAFLLFLGMSKEGVGHRNIDMRCLIRILIFTRPRRPTARIFLRGIFGRDRAIALPMLVGFLVGFLTGFLVGRLIGDAVGVTCGLWDGIMVVVDGLMVIVGVITGEAVGTLVGTLLDTGVDTGVDTGELVD